MVRKSRLHLKNTRYQQAICIVYDSVAEVMPELFSSFLRSSLSAMKTRWQTFAKILISSRCRVYHQLGYETDDNKVLIISISSHDFSSVATRNKTESTWKISPPIELQYNDRNSLYPECINEFFRWQ